MIHHIKNLSLFAQMGLALLAVTLPVSSVRAQPSTPSDAITPSDVYLSTEILRLELENRNLFNGYLYRAEPLDTTLRHPRHVMQKVRECHQIFSKMLEDKNIKTDPLPELLSLREIRPSDVKFSVDFLIKEVTKLSDAPAITPPPFVAQKVPVDVYNNLKSICHAVNIKIEPSDIYQIATTVLKNMQKIAVMRGYDLTVNENEFKSKSSKEVYDETWSFLNDLRALALNPDYAIPGGVILPYERKTENIQPQDVIALMNDALAETDAIKYSLYIREKTHLPAYQMDKTLTDAGMKIYAAHQIVLRLLILEEMPLEREKM